MSVDEYIAKQSPERRELLLSLNHIILKTNRQVKPEVATMMGSEMIHYKVDNLFVYALASPKNYMSIHAMPMYACKPIHEKYSGLLKKAKVQKGCINFKNAAEMPLDIAEQFFTDCAKIDWKAEIEKQKGTKS